MKTLFWTVLAVAAVANVIGNLTLNGPQQILLSVGTGSLVLASAAALFWLRGTHS